MWNGMPRWENNLRWWVKEKFIDPPKKTTVVGCKRAYNIKNTAKNDKKYRVHLSVQGFEQKSGIGFNDILSSVVDF